MTELDPYGRIFREGAGVNSPFLDQRWPILLFPEYLPRRVSAYFEPLSRVAKELGDNRVLLVDEQDPEVRFVESWEPEEFARTRFQIPLGALMFGDSSRWGAVLTDEGFTCLGGEHPVIAQVAEGLGGKDVIRRGFDDWLKTADGFLFSSEKAAALRRLNRWEPSAHE